MRSFLFLLTLCSFAYSHKDVKEDEDADMREALSDLHNLNQDYLLQALKHSAFQNDPRFSSEDKEMVNKLSKDELRDLINRFADTPNENEEENENEDEEQNFLQGDDKRFDVYDEEDLDNADVDDVMKPYGDKMSDPWGRRRRRSRKSQRRRKIIAFFRKLRVFLRKHGEKIQGGITALRRAIWHCCYRTRRCQGKWFCKFGKP